MNRGKNIKKWFFKLRGVSLGWFMQSSDLWWTVQCDISELLPTGVGNRCMNAAGIPEPNATPRLLLPVTYRRILTIVGLCNMTH